MRYSPILMVHIAAGIAALPTGAAAFIFRKGSERHRLYGNLFFISMMLLGITAAPLGNVVGGLMTVYLVGTAWITARYRDGRGGIIDWVAMGGAVVGGVLIFWGGMQAWKTPTHSINGVPAGMSFFLAIIMTLCAIGDIRMLVRGGLTGTARIARHLWRMCFASFIATGSFFLGRIRIFPQVVRDAYIPFLLAVLPLLLLVYWMIRVRTRSAQRKMVVAAG